VANEFMWLIPYTGTVTVISHGLGYSHVRPESASLTTHGTHRASSLRHPPPPFTRVSDKFTTVNIVPYRSSL
jgi:hypothetical protein